MANPKQALKVDHAGVTPSPVANEASALAAVAAAVAPSSAPPGVAKPRPVTPKVGVKVDVIKGVKRERN